jgi:hypothetical protein
MLFSGWNASGLFHILTSKGRKEDIMKTFAAVAGGFCLTITVFFAGALTAVFFTSAEPVQDRQLSADTRGLWVDKATRVDVAGQVLERVPARPVVETVVPRQDPVEHAPEVFDTMMTASTSDQAAPAAFSPPHIEWCAARYRSYDPSDNTYRAYSGNRRDCVSPFVESGYDDFGASPDAEVSVVNISAAEEVPAWDHIQSCFSRYRSYRPEDNSYQPYGGGPRQQCE